MADAVAPVRHLLANSAGLTAQVATSAIVGGVLPQGTQPPAVAVTLVTTRRMQNVAAGSGLAVARVQVSVVASGYPQLRAVLDLVRAALPRSRGTVNGVAVDSIVPDTEGPDFTDDAGLAYGSQDYIVVFNE